jgi:hypothetical protein
MLQIASIMPAIKSKKKVRALGAIEHCSGSWIRTIRPTSR